MLSFYVDLVSSFDAHAPINYKSFSNLAEIISDSSEEL
ncbi:hypothetical protein SAMN06298216_4208 [Spirosomataceae bacterium TFI 002]|nr:hypothetical protein SAMN06298216_4208 [Spirosomataceae bacterium TFI 002]